MIFGNRVWKYFTVLDIETSSAVNDEGKPIDVWLSYGALCLYRSEDGFLVRRWPFTEWETLRAAFENLKQRMYGRGILCYVHNLAFDGDFLIKNIGFPDDMCATKTHRIVSMVLKSVEWVEFRCSYMLTDKPLAALGDIIGLPKLDGDYTSHARGYEPTAKDWEYNFRDCDIVARYLAEHEFPAAGIWKTPLTKTGKVRNMLKERLKGIPRKWDIKPDESIYRMLRLAFYGGVSGSNPKHTSIPLENIDSFDESSAYPYVALTERYPTRWEEANDCQRHLHWIAPVSFYFLSAKFGFGWLPNSRGSDQADVVTFNGKVISAHRITFYLCDIDFENVKLWYDFDYADIGAGIVSDEDDYLPDQIYSLFIDLAAQKQEAKKRYKADPSPENQIAYAKAKERFNCLYGMMVQKMENSHFAIDENTALWTEIDDEYKETGQHMNRNYGFGVYITAYSRRNLLLFIAVNGKTNTVAWDTDSAKIKDCNPAAIVDTNSKQDIIARFPIGNIGQWEHECRYDRFKTFGAKKHIFEIGGQMGQTIAGVPKGEKYKNPFTFDEIMCGTNFKDCKLAKAYLFRGRAFAFDEYGESVEEYDASTYDRGGCALYRVGYRLDMTENDKNYIQNVYGRIVQHV